MFSTFICYVLSSVSTHCLVGIPNFVILFIAKDLAYTPLILAELSVFFGEVLKNLSSVQWITIKRKLTYHKHPLCKQFPPSLGAQKNVKNAKILFIAFKMLLNYF
ncbi:hypothetical protein PHSC3_001982 [Chlamydiales bacterium STE3]|nr:hypothetical protein PHSC3_001982 [Chlamydiales bacterium STE3]